MAEITDEAGRVLFDEDYGEIYDEYGATAVPCSYLGLVPVSYLQYLDLQTGRTLSPSPGQACTPLPVSGNMPPVPPDGNWVVQ